MPPSVTLLPVTYDPNAFVDNIYTNLQRLEVGVEQAESNLPIGSIILWYGIPANVPAGWQICDGTNGTPNLKGRVPVGVDAAQTEFDTMGKLSGAKTHALTQAELAIHGHVASSAAESQEHVHNANHGHTADDNQVGAHSHAQAPQTAVTTASTVGLVPTGSNQTAFSDFFRTSTDGAHNHDITVNPNNFNTAGRSATHTHGVTVNNAGSGNAHNNLQPSLALHFLMKVA